MQYEEGSDASKRLQALAEVSPTTADFLIDNPEMTLGQYAVSLYENDGHEPTSREIDAREMFITVMEKWAIFQYGDKAAKVAMEQFRETPVMQAADHLQLILDPATFSTNLISRIGAKGTGQRFTFVNASSTVTMKTRSGVGPGYLDIDGQKISIFGISSNKMSKMMVGSTARAVEFLWDGAQNILSEKIRTEFKEIQDTVKSFTSSKFGGLFSSPADAFITANTAISRKWDTDNEVLPVYTDDRIVAELIALHIETNSHELCTLLFDEATRSRWMKLQDSHTDANAKALPNTTDHFWRIREGRLRPLKLINNELIELGRGEAPIPFNRECISKALRDGEIMPNLTLGFLAISILPGVKVLGGPSQNEYLPMIAHDASQALDDMTLKTRSGWIAGVLELERPPIELVSECKPGVKLEELSIHFQELPLSAAVGELNFFEYLRSWTNDAPVL